MAFTRVTLVTMLASLLTASAPAARDATVVRHFTPLDQESQRYAYVPFTVPAGTTGLTVSYRYDPADGANAIDLGLFEPGELTLGSSAFRGWSGGSRDRISVGVGGASPGYWPGPLPAGTWHLVLGLYKVAARGVDVSLSIELAREPATGSPAFPERRTSALRAQPGWYAGIVHAHTTESDGALAVPELVDQARREKLDFLAITDHNNTTHQRFPLDRPDLLVITGEEVTTPAGHFNVWGLGGPRDYVDFRIPAGDTGLTTVIEAAHRRGALVSINHPFTDCLACTWTHAIPSSLDAIEIANGTAVGRQQSIALWDTLLRAGRRVTAVEGRDWHRGPDPLAAPALRVWASELSTTAILEGIHQGRAVVMANATLPVPDLTIEGGGTLARIGDSLTIARGQPVQVDVATPPAYRGARVDWIWNGEVVASASAGDGHTRFERSPAASGYARVHVVDADGNPLAITNPIYITVH